LFGDPLWQFNSSTLRSNNYLAPFPSFQPRVYTGPSSASPFTSVAEISPSIQLTSFRVALDLIYLVPPPPLLFLFFYSQFSAFNRAATDFGFGRSSIWTPVGPRTPPRLFKPCLAYIHPCLPRSILIIPPFDPLLIYLSFQISVTPQGKSYLCQSPFTPLPNGLISGTQVLPVALSRSPIVAPSTHRRYTSFQTAPRQ